jgi:uncharacterized protein YaiI (UPF0178 family)
MSSLELQLTVVSSIFLAADQQFGVEKLAVASGTDLINRLPSCQPCQPNVWSELGLLYRRVQINEDRAGDIFAVARLGKEGLERTTLIDFLALLRIQTTIRAQTVLKEIPELLTQRDDERFEAMVKFG